MGTSQCKKNQFGNSSAIVYKLTMLNLENIIVQGLHHITQCIEIGLEKRIGQYHVYNIACNAWL